MNGEDHPRNMAQKTVLPDDVVCPYKLMNGKDHPRNMTQEKHSYYTAKHKGKIGFASPRFTSSYVGTPVESLD